MTDLWMPGATRHPAALDGGSMVGGPARAVWHTTESDPGSIRGVVNWLDQQRTHPHLTWDPSTGEVRQHIPANRAARALKHPAGTPETNRMGGYCIQIEVVGRASKPFTARPVIGLDRILAWLDALGIRRHAWDGGRMPRAQWASFGGHCGHAHVPDNDHTDPGAIDWMWLLGMPVPGPSPKPAPAPAPKPTPVPVPSSSDWDLDVKLINLAGVRRGVPSTYVKGSGVKALQRLLGVAVDGVAGGDTADALEAAQARHKLVKDRKAGKATYTALLSE